MRAAWYERRGSARETLVVGQMPDPVPAEGEVRMAIRVSGLSPGDVKKRSGFPDDPPPPLDYPRVIPHSDGAGVIDAVGSGVSPDRVGRPAWCYGAQSYRPFGTAAQYVCVPEQLAIDLPIGRDDDEGLLDLFEQAACLGIAGITGYRSLFADGSVRGLTVLVHGAVGGVGSIATQMAVRDGARVLAVVRDESQRDRASALGASQVFLENQPDLAAAVRAVAPDGVHRIAEIDLAAHADLDAAIIAVGGVIGSFATSQPRTTLPYWLFGFADTTLRLLGSDDFTPSVKAHAAAELTAALAAGALRSTVAERVPLAEIARAHELVERGTAGRVVVEVA